MLVQAAAITSHNGTRTEGHSTARSGDRNRPEHSNSICTRHSMRERIHRNAAANFYCASCDVPAEP